MSSKRYSRSSSSGGEARSRYLPPQGALRRGLHGVYIGLAYDVWRRELRTRGGWRHDARLRVLECGSGPGLFLKLLGKWFPNAVTFGLDRDRSLLRASREEAPRACFIEASAEELPFGNWRFDVIVALQIIEHLPHPERFVAEARRVLKGGGWLIMATPNPGGVCARIMGRRWNGWSDDSHINLHPPSYWRALLGANGFSMLKDGTTGLSGIPIVRVPPLGLLNWVPLAIWGVLPWTQGESYACIAAVAAGPEWRSST